MGRTDTATRFVPARPDRVYEALIDADALLAWLPPTGMTATLRDFDARPGGGYRMRLTYREAPASGGKSDDDSDEVAVRFTELVPGERLVQEVDFTTDDPAYAGTMRMTWSIVAVAEGSQVTITCDDVPPGISPEDHAAGLGDSLSNLAAYLT